MQRKAIERLADLIDEDRALRTAAAIAYSDIRQLCDATGQLLPMSQWPVVERIAPPLQVNTDGLWKLLNDADDHKQKWSTTAWQQWFTQIVDATSQIDHDIELIAEAADGNR